VVLELPNLTHEMIARMVAARRPSVTTAIRRLRELGVVEVQTRGHWILRGDPVEALAAITEQLPELQSSAAHK
jgi:Mn-dependent DtxR family transcriptional regulator